MSGADLAYQEMLARAGVATINAGGHDAARLGQMQAEAADDGNTLKFWDYTKVTPDIIDGFQWIIYLAVGQEIPDWLPVGSFIVREVQ